MSRSGYTDDCDGWALICWRGAVASAIRGKRGQAVLKELLAALDALPERRLAADSLTTEEGQFCTLGALGRARGMDLTPLDSEEREEVARAFGMTKALACEIMYLNDESAGNFWEHVEICGPMRPNYPDYGRHERTVRLPDERAAAKRWEFMRDWVAKNIKDLKGKEHENKVHP